MGVTHCYRNSPHGVLESQRGNGDHPGNTLQRFKEVVMFSFFLVATLCTHSLFSLGISMTCLLKRFIFITVKLSLLTVYKRGAPLLRLRNWKLHSIRYTYIVISLCLRLLLSIFWLMIHTAIKRPSQNRHNRHPPTSPCHGMCCRLARRRSLMSSVNTARRRDTRVLFVPATALCGHTGQLESRPAALSDRALKMHPSRAADSASGGHWARADQRGEAVEPASPTRRGVDPLRASSVTRLVKHTRAMLAGEVWRGLRGVERGRRVLRKWRLTTLCVFTFSRQPFSMGGIKYPSPCVTCTYLRVVLLRTPLQFTAPLPTPLSRASFKFGSQPSLPEQVQLVWGHEWVRKLGK